jgi:predicted RNase H-like nuclease (RuvC/YqgF family)
MSETISRKRCCSYCHQSDGHNIRSCTKRIHDENEVLYQRHRKKTEEVRKRLVVEKNVVELEAKIAELSEEVGEYKQEILRKRQIIGNLLYDYESLSRENVCLVIIAEKLKNTIEKLREKKAINNDTFAVHSMKELLVKAKECCDICYTDFNYDNIVIKSCWHKCCTTCNEQLDKCHVCRQ